MDNSKPPEPAVYGVWADHSTLKRESLGPLFGRITMGLRGPVDALWRESYMAVRADSEAFARFTLDRTADQLSFTFRSMEVASEIETLLERLDLSIELANLHATAAASVAQNRQKKA
ncbi:MAG: hypothetical protein ABR610_17170 [Thermoanaerobaculia bacterium]